MKNRTDRNEERNKPQKAILILIAVLILACAGILLYPSLHDYQCRNRVYDEFSPTIDRIKDSSISIIAVYKNESSTSYSSGASGVVFSKKGDTCYALTARHVVTGKATKYKIHTVDTPTYWEYRKKANNTSHVSLSKYYGTLSDAKIEYVYPDADLAVISFKPDNNQAVAPVASNVPLKNDRIAVVSNPEGEKFVVSYGKITSGLTEFKADGESDSAMDRVLKHNAYEAPGSSGSGTFDAKGEIVGINIGGGRDRFDRFKYGVMIPCDQVQECIEKWESQRTNQAIR